MQRIDRRRSIGGLPAHSSACQQGGYQASSPRLRPAAACRDSSPSDRSKGIERSGLAAAARLAAASSGDLTMRSSRPATGATTERARRHSMHSGGPTALPGTGSPPPPLRHAWRFTAAPASEIPPPPSAAPPPPTRTPQSHCRDLPSAPVPVTPQMSSRDVWASKCPASPAPQAERQLRSALERRSSGGPTGCLERQPLENIGSYAPPPKFEFGPATASAEATPAPARRLTRARSALRTSQTQEPVRSHSADPRRRKEQEREDSIDTTEKQEERQGHQEEAPAYRRFSNAGGAHGGAKTERHARTGEGGRVADRLAELAAASSALSPSLRRPPPFKTLSSAAFGGKYTAGRYLGRGASATVWEASHSDSNLRVAVKVFDQGSRDKRQATREVKVLSRILHPNIVEAYEVIEGSLYSQLVCELVDGESLRAFAQRQPGHRLEESVARHYYQQVVEGVSYCHDRLVVHRDLKLENLLLDRSGEHVKIIDFGFATQVADRNAKLRAFCGTPSYMAPEIVRGEGYSGFSTDVWALGVVVFALLAGTLPFIGRTEMQLYAKIRRGSFTCPDALGEAPRRLVRAMLRLDSSSRPSSAAILRQAWVSGLSSSNMESARGARDTGGTDSIDSSVLRSPTMAGFRSTLPAPAPASGGENESPWTMIMGNSPGRSSMKNILEPRSDLGVQAALRTKEKEHRRASIGDRPESPSCRRRHGLGDPRRSRVSLPGAAGTALGGS